MNKRILLYTIIIASLAFSAISCEEETVDESCYSQELFDQFDSTNCPFINQPVCGCDNVTYLNACLANKAGFAIQDSLPCVEQ